MIGPMILLLERCGLKPSTESVRPTRAKVNGESRVKNLMYEWTQVLLAMGVLLESYGTVIEDQSHTRDTFTLQS